MSDPRACDGVIFDAGDILYDATPWRRWLTGQLQGLGVEITYPRLVERWESLLVDVYRGRAEYWQRFAQLLADCGVAGEAAEDLADRARQQGKAVQVDRRPFPGVPETLAELRRRGLKLAVLSDTESPADKVRAGLAKLGVADFFDAIVTSFDIGHVKPQREAYQAAADAIGVPLERCLFVGHDQDELTGAQQAGVTAVAFNFDEDVEAEHRIRRFGELTDLAP